MQPLPSLEYEPAIWTTATISTDYLVSHGRHGQYFTVVEHMPANHQLYSEWDSARFLKWSSDIGEATRQVVQRMFESYRVEEQAYKGCLSLLKLSDKYTPKRLEDACRLALTRIPNPRYKNIRLILEASQDKKATEDSKASAKTPSSDKYAIVRGAAYYGGGNHEE